MTEHKKRVATHTFLNSDNYGSVLQAYALLKTLNKMGYDAFAIDYYKDEVKSMYQIIKPNTSKYNFIMNCYSHLHYKQLLMKQKRYADFRNRYIERTPIQYTEHRQLLVNPPAAECYICGSDQVWNTQISDFDNSYLLDFVQSGRKISYAASGITKNTPDSGVDMIISALKNFDAVSVREEIGKERINKRLGDTAIRVLDPVLLLTSEEWRDVLADYSYDDIPQKKPYMFCYFAGGVSKDFEKYTVRLAKKMGIKRILIMPEWRNVFRSGEKYYQAGPMEFLKLLNSAEIVCTDSFHGTALSVLLNKLFVVGMHIPFSENRITTLLNSCGLADREIDPAMDEPDNMIKQIDFSKCNSILRAERERSINWLKSAIEGEK